MAPNTQRYVSISGAVVLAALAIACGSNGNSPTSPSGGVATITLTANGASPSVTHISVGQQVRFVNNDNQDHQINSDPFPSHADCPAINDVGRIMPGESKTSGTFSASVSCGFHDHLHHDAKNFQGQILVDTNTPAPGYSTAR